MSKTHLLLLPLCAMTLHAGSTLFHNGKIFESYRSETPLTEFRVFNGRVIDKAVPPETKVDLKGRYVFPSVTDAHAHLFDIGKVGFEIDLKGTKSPAAVVARVKRFRAAHPSVKILTGFGWDQSDWPDKKFSDRTVLDATNIKIPIVLYRVDGHAAWVNTEALKRSEIWNIRFDPNGGKILRGEDGKPAGVLIDNAMDLLTKLFEMSDADAEKYLLAAVREAHSYGITSIHDAGIDSKYLPVFKKVLKKTSFRFYEMIFSPDVPPVINELDGRYTVRAIKMLADGGMGSRGALFDQPYSDDPENNGLQLISDEDLVRRMQEADAKGFQIAVHAIGSKATRIVVDAMEKALGPAIASKRPRLEHAQILERETIQRMKKLGIIASMQPSHCTSDMKWVEARIRKERAKYAYAWKTILTNQIPLAFGSDAPVESLNPWPGIHSAVTRSNGESVFNESEKVSVREALTAFSEGAAYAAFLENDLGTLAPGKYADFFITSQNPLEATNISNLKVEETYVGGKRVWKR